MGLLGGWVYWVGDGMGGWWVEKERDRTVEQPSRQTDRQTDIIIISFFLSLRANLCQIKVHKH